MNFGKNLKLIFYEIIKLARHGFLNKIMQINVNYFRIDHMKILIIYEYIRILTDKFILNQQKQSVLKRTMH